MIPRARRYDYPCPKRLKYNVENNRNATVVGGNDAITVKAGTRSVTVKGNSSLTVQAGDRIVNVTAITSLIRPAKSACRLRSKITTDLRRKHNHNGARQDNNQRWRWREHDTGCKCIDESAAGSKVLLDANADMESSGGSQVLLDAKSAYEK